MRGEQFRQIDRVTREYPEHEEAEDRQHEREIFVGAQPKVEHQARGDGAGVVEQDRRLAAHEVGKEPEAGIANDRAQAPQPHPVTDGGDGRCAGDAFLLQHQALDRGQPELAGPDRQQRADAEQQADEGAESQRRSE